jgi:hypothetical protein
MDRPFRTRSVVVFLPYFRSFIGLIQKPTNTLVLSASFRKLQTPLTDLPGILATTASS